MNKRKSAIIKVLLLAAFLSYFVYKMYEQQRILDIKKREYEQLQALIAEEQQLYRDLQEKNETLNTDEYIERIAREKLGMVKEGEKIFIDVNDN